MEMLDWKSTMTKMKTSLEGFALEGFDSAFEPAEGLVDELEGSSIDSHVV